MSPRLHLVAEPALVGSVDAARFVGISRSTLDRLNRRGVIGPQPIHLGGRRLWRLDELRLWIDAGRPTREEWLAGAYKHAPDELRRALNTTVPGRTSDVLRE